MIGCLLVVTVVTNPTKLKQPFFPNTDCSTPYINTGSREVMEAVLPNLLFGDGAGAAIVTSAREKGSWRLEEPAGILLGPETANYIHLKIVLGICVRKGQFWEFLDNHARPSLKVGYRSLESPKKTASSAQINLFKVVLKSLKRFKRFKLFNKRPTTFCPSSMFKVSYDCLKTKFNQSGIGYRNAFCPVMKVSGLANGKPTRGYRKAISLALGSMIRIQELPQAGSQELPPHPSFLCSETRSAALVRTGFNWSYRSIKVDNAS
eukprot:sb/3468367/